MLKVKVVLLTFCAKKNKGDILRNTKINELQDSFKSMLKTTLIDNRQVSIDNLYVTGDFAFLVILLG